MVARVCHQQRSLPCGNELHKKYIMIMEKEKAAERKFFTFLSAAQEGRR
jgi:hypothetical protein